VKIGKSILGINAQFDDLLKTLSKIFPLNLYLMRRNTAILIEGQPVFRRNIRNPLSELGNPDMKAE
jgi:hypothetical protein